MLKERSIDLNMCTHRLIIYQTQLILHTHICERATEQKISYIFLVSTRIESPVRVLVLPHPTSEL